MDAAEVIQVVREEIARLEPFDNWHGIDRHNLAEHLVEPYEASVVLEDSDVGTRAMWIVLHEHSTGDGYAIAFDPASATWVLVDVTAASYVEIDTAGSLAAALDVM